MLESGWALPQCSVLGNSQQAGPGPPCSVFLGMVEGSLSGTWPPVAARTPCPLMWQQLCQPLGALQLLRGWRLMGPPMPQP